MVNEYRSEEEQLETLRRWWNENGRTTVIAVVVALAAGFGWQGWKQHRQTQNEAASDIYQQLVQIVTAAELTGEQRETVAVLAARLKESYPDTGYAAFSTLHLARLAVQQEDLAAAEAELRWVLEHVDERSEAAHVATMRLARVLAAQGRADQALSVLQQQLPDAQYTASYARVRGDILMAAGREAEAQAAYDGVRQRLAEAELAVNQPLMQARLQALDPRDRAEDTPAVESGDDAGAARQPQSGQGG